MLRASCASVDTDIYQVHVDEIEAELAPDAEFWSSELGLARIDPPPQPGQQVVVSRCTDGPDSRTCEDEPTWVEVTEYTATEPDDLVPTVTGVVTLQHGDNSVADCTGGDLVFRATLPELVYEEAPVLFRARLQTPSGAVIGTRMRLVDEPLGELSFSFHVESSQLGAPPEELCVDVVAIDLSGNLAEVDEICGSMAEPGSDTSASDTGDESTGSSTTTGDGVSTGEAPGGSPTGVSETSGSDQDGAITDRGCACTTVQSTPSSPVWAVGSFGWLLFIRRHRLRRP